MTTPRSLDKKKITLWPGREISALLTSIAVDILGSDRSCIKTAVPVLTAHCNVVLVVLWLPMVSWLLTPVGPGGRQRERRGPLQDSNTILCCPTHWVSHTRRTTEHNTTDKIAHIFFPNPPDLMLGLWCSGVQLARHFHFSISWRKINNSQHLVKNSYLHIIEKLQLGTGDIVNMSVGISIGIDIDADLYLVMSLLTWVPLKHQYQLNSDSAATPLTEMIKLSLKRQQDTECYRPNSVLIFSSATADWDESFVLFIARLVIFYGSLSYQLSGAVNC